MQAWANLLKSEMRKRDINQSELSVIIKKPASTVSHWLAGSRIPPVDDMIKVLQLLDIAEFTINADSSVKAKKYLRKRTGYLVELLKICEVHDNDNDKIQVVGTDHADSIRAIEFSDEKAHQIFGGLPSDRVKILTVNNDSMSGTIETGDLVFIDSSKTQYDGDGIYIFLFQNTLFIKRLQKVIDKFLVISDNDCYETWEINKNNINQINILGKVMLSQTHKLNKHS